jgi:2-methylisocitrate lyase-like PEP mutase family enzyme
MTTQIEKGKTFQALHQRGHAFIIPNPWDIGTARLLARCGFEALATTSAGYAFSFGQKDNTVGREQMMAHVSALAAATNLPLSADLGNGFGDDPGDAAEAVRLAAAAGAVGGSIEDSTGKKEKPLYEKKFAAERVAAAAEIVRSLPFIFTLTARAENFLFNEPDLNDTIERLQAYQEAGADVLFAPGVTRKEDIAAIVSSVDRPINALMGLAGCNLNLKELSALGVRRVSVGSSLCRAALGAFLRAAGEMRDHGSFGFALDAPSYKEIEDMFGD